jgi:hypothetical protein
VIADFMRTPSGTTGFSAMPGCRLTYRVLQHRDRDEDDWINGRSRTGFPGANVLLLHDLDAVVHGRLTPQPRSSLQRW